MTDDNDLKRMFDAQRIIDAQSAPAFDEIASPIDSTVGPVTVVSNAKSSLASVSFALSAIVLSAVVGFRIWLSTAHLDKPNTSSTSLNAMRRLDQVSDSVLLRIKDLDPEILQNVGNAMNEMVWPTGTDSLIPFDTLTTNFRRPS